MCEPENVAVPDERRDVYCVSRSCVRGLGKVGVPTTSLGCVLRERDAIN